MPKSTTTKNADLGKEILKASKKGDLKKVQELLSEDPALVGARDVDGSTPLHCAVWKGHKPVVELLLKQGADVNAENQNDHWGTTPLHAAAHANQRAIAEVLIAHRAKVNGRNINGRTPLGETEFHKAKPVATLLKENGGDL